MDTTQEPPPDNPESKKILKQVPGLPPKPKPYFPVLAMTPIEGLILFGASIIIISWALKGDRRV